MTRAEFLDTLDKSAPHFDPCRCDSCPDGYTFSIERNQWVHANCMKPSGGHWGYSPYCYECGIRFTYKVYQDEPQKWGPCCE